MRETLIRRLQTTIGPEADATRPTLLSVAITGTVALAVLVGIGTAIGVRTPVAIGLAAGCVLAVAVTLSAGDRPIVIMAGTGLLLVAGPVFVSMPVYQFVTEGFSAGAMVACAGLVAYGLARFRVDAFGDRAVTAALTQLFGVTAVASIVLLGLVVVRADALSTVPREVAPEVGAFLEYLLVPSASETAIPEFALLLGLTVLAIWAAVAVVPLVQLAPRQYKHRLDDTASSLSTALGRTVLLCAGVLVATSVLPVATGTSDRLEWVYYDLSPLGHAVLSAIVESSLLRRLLAVLFVSAVVVMVAVGVFAFAGARLAGDSPARFLPALCWGGVVVVAGAVGAPMLLDAVSPLLGPEQDRLVQNAIGLLGETVLGVGAVVIALSLTGAVLLALPILSGLGFVPDRSAGVRLVMAGTFLTTVVGAIADVGVVALIGGIVAVMVIWDVGEFSVTLAEELGSNAPTRHSELVHLAGSVVVSVVVLLAAIATTGLLDGASPEGAVVLPGLVFATIAAVALTIGIRG